MLHELLKDNNMTLVTSAVVSDNIDFKDAISRFLVSWYILSYKTCADPESFARGGQTLTTFFLCR